MVQGPSPVRKRGPQTRRAEGKPSDPVRAIDLIGGLAALHAFTAGVRKDKIVGEPTRKLPGNRLCPHLCRWTRDPLNRKIVTWASPPRIITSWTDGGPPRRGETHHPLRWGKGRRHGSSHPLHRRDPMLLEVHDWSAQRTGGQALRA